MANFRNLKTFSNGEEFRLFMGKNCEQCDNYVNWEDATEEEPVCPIENQIFEAMFDESKFPNEYIVEELDESGRPYVPICTNKNKPLPQPTNKKQDGQEQISLEALLNEDD